MIICCFLLSLPLLPIFLITVTCLFIYKNIIIAILKAKYGTKLTLIDSIDSYFTIGKFQENFSFVLTTMRTNTSEEVLKEKMVEAVDESIIKNVDHFKKLHSSLHNFMGFSFLLREEIRADDLVNIIDMDKDRYESVNHLTCEFIKKSLYKNDKLLIHSTILKCSDEWKIRNNFGVDQIPVLIRIHHILGDGLSMMNLFVQLFGDNKLVIENVMKEFNKKYKRPNYWRRLFEDVYSFLLLPGFILYDRIERTMNKRRFIGSAGSGKQYFAKKFADNTVTIQKIKDLKRKIGDCGFTEILLTAISASLFEYFRAKNVEIPLTVSTALIVLKDMEDINVNGIPKLKNQFKFLPLEIPIKVGSESMLERLNATKKYTRMPSLIMNFLLQNSLLHILLGLLPRPIRKLCYKTKHTNMVLSNLLGIPKITFFNGIEIDEIFFFVIGREELGMGYSVITYDDKIHLSFKAYETIVSSQEDCQKLVDNVFKYLNEFIMELCDK